MSDSEVRRPRDASGQRLAEEFTLEPDGRLRAWLRERDRMGALSEAHAALDDALARGYAQGLEEARADALDSLRTLVLTLLEQRFGEVDDESMDKIGEARAEQLEKWVTSVIPCATVAEVLGMEVAAADGGALGSEALDEEISALSADQPLSGPSPRG